MQSNFLYTFIGLLIGALAVVAFIIWKIPPTPFVFLGLLMLIGFIIHIVFALIFYFFSKPRGHEANKLVFRRSLKKTVIFGLIFIVVLLAQRTFDLI